MVGVVPVRERVGGAGVRVVERSCLVFEGAEIERHVGYRNLNCAHLSSTGTYPPRVETSNIICVMFITVA